ncbi:hypothetical protein J2S34_001417 [Nitrobacter winogradskyi]|uniref:Uncharacterized protein n=1 Tax=Nitrobacter winogradskyi TaxID=913 RepID=A0ACC6AJF7_NITWI|nr:hypothetical protein [Nitrobacter winogradskyi]MCP1998995.1 hypothetical protein [Nitrobacter winogradskyi]
MMKVLFGLAIVGLFMFGGQSDAQARYRNGHHSDSHSYKHKSHHHKGSCWRTNRHTGGKFRIC